MIASSTYLILKKLDLINQNKSNDKYEIIQKTLCILQYMDFDINVIFRWYNNGVYAIEISDLVTDISNNEDYFKENYKRIRLKKEYSDILDKFKEIFGDKRNDKNFIKIVSSILFISDYYRANINNIKEVFEKVNPLKFEKKDLDEAFKFVIKNKKYLLDKIFYETLRGYGSYARRKK